MTRVTSTELNGSRRRRNRPGATPSFGRQVVRKAALVPVASHGGWYASGNSRAWITCRASRS